MNNGELHNLKYLLVLQDRLEYDDVKIEPEESGELEKLWARLFEQYNTLEKNYGAVNFLSDKSKIIYYYALYIQEQSVLKSLMYRTNVGHIRLLRERGYEISNLSQLKYWESLRNGLKRVQAHLAYIEILKNKIKSVEGDSKKEGNPFDAIMAWIASNDIRVDENISVARYVKVKEIILKRQKAKQQEQSKSRLYGR